MYIICICFLHEIDISGENEKENNGDIKKKTRIRDKVMDQMNGQKCMSYSLVQQQAGRKFVSELPPNDESKERNKIDNMFQNVNKIGAILYSG